MTFVFHWTRLQVLEWLKYPRKLNEREDFWAFGNQVFVKPFFFMTSIFQTNEILFLFFFPLFKLFDNK